MLLDVKVVLTHRKRDMQPVAASMEIGSTHSETLELDYAQSLIALLKLKKNDDLRPWYTPVRKNSDEIIDIVYN